MLTSCQIRKIDPSGFDGLINLAELRITECTIRELHTDSFLKLSNLQLLTFNLNNVQPPVDYSIFKNLPSLEKIFFDLEVYQELDFTEFPKLKSVKIGFRNKDEEEFRKIIIGKLEECRLGYELVCTETFEQCSTS